jgi:hypothetical protein
MDAQNEARAGEAEIHLLDKAVERRDPDPVDGGRRDSRRPQCRRKLPSKKRAKPAEHIKGKAVPTC